MLMLIHTSGGMASLNSYYFALANVSLNLIVACMTFRAGFCISLARFSAFWFGGSYLLEALCWFLVAVCPSQELSEALWLVAVLIEPVSTALLFLLDEGRHLVPITEEYAVAKFNAMYV